VEVASLRFVSTGHRGGTYGIVRLKQRLILWVLGHQDGRQLRRKA